MEKRESKERNLMDEVDCFLIEDVAVKVIYNKNGPDVEECIKSVLEDYFTLEAD